MGRNNIHNGLEYINHFLFLVTFELTIRDRNELSSAGLNQKRKMEVIRYFCIFLLIIGFYGMESSVH